MKQLERGCLALLVDIEARQCVFDVVSVSSMLV
jgi:hypothetical protein